MLCYYLTGQLHSTSLFKPISGLCFVILYFVILGLLPGYFNISVWVVLIKEIGHLGIHMVYVTVSCDTGEADMSGFVC